MTAPKVIILGWIGSTNLGDELIADAMCELLRHEGCEPTVATINEEASAALGVPMVRHAGAFDTMGLAQAMRQHDAAVFGGGGLIQDETGPFNLPFHLTRLATARILRKPWAGVGLGVGDVRRTFGRAIGRAVLRNPVSISVRDAASAGRFLDLTGAPAQLGLDPILGLQPLVGEPTEQIVVSLRPPNRPDQRSLASTGGIAEQQLKTWAKAIDGIAEQHSLEVRFVTWDESHDYEVHKQVAARLRSRFTILRPTASDVVDRMAGGRLVLTMRYHGAVAAVLAGRPAVVLDYSPKMADLCREVGRGLLPVAPDATVGEITDAATAVLSGPAPSVDTITGRAERLAVNRGVIAELAEAARRKR